MIPFRKWLGHQLILCFISVLIFFSSYMRLFADEIKWKQVANTINEIQFIDSNSIKYNKGILSLITKYSEINPEDGENITSDSYLLAIDCENRLYSRLPLNTELKQVKTWIKPSDKLIKTTILNSCTY